MQTDMRTKKQIFMLLLALLVGIPTLSAQQSKKEKKETEVSLSF